MSFKDRPLLTLEQANRVLDRHSDVMDFRLLGKNARRITGSALARCDFDFSLARPGLNSFGDGRVLIKPRAGWPGALLAPERILVVHFGVYKDGPMWAGKNAWKIQATVLHECAHGFGDLLTLSGEQRIEMFTALHEHEPDGMKQMDATGNLPVDWAYDREVPYGHGHSWFDDTYEDGVGEAFAECWLAAFSDIPAEHYSHESTPSAIRAVRNLYS